MKVIESNCELVPVGSTYLLSGPILDIDNSKNVCVTALTSLLPWIMAARFGVCSKNLGWDGTGYHACCPENSSVKFRIETLE